MAATIAARHRIWRLCQCCAKWLNPDNADDAAALLFGTAAQESDFLYRRQLGFDGDSRYVLRGAFGLWQCEPVSIINSLERLQRAHVAEARALNFLAVYPHCHDVFVRGVKSQNPDEICIKIMEEEHDPLACLFARLHYLWDARPIPTTVFGHACYWKRVYNTAYGAGEARDYVEAWQDLCEPVAGVRA